MEENKDPEQIDLSQTDFYEFLDRYQQTGSSDSILNHFDTLSRDALYNGREVHDGSVVFIPDTLKRLISGYNYIRFDGPPADIGRPNVNVDHLKLDSIVAFAESLGLRVIVTPYFSSGAYKVNVFDVGNTTSNSDNAHNNPNSTQSNIQNIRGNVSFGVAGSRPALGSPKR